MPIETFSGGISTGEGNPNFFSADGAYLRVGKMAHQVAHAVRLEHLVRIGADQDIGGCALCQIGDDRKLAAAPREGPDADAGRLNPAQDLGSRIRGRIEPDEDFRELRWIVNF